MAIGDLRDTAPPLTAEDRERIEKLADECRKMLDKENELAFCMRLPRGACDLLDYRRLAAIVPYDLAFALLWARRAELLLRYDPDGQEPDPLTRWYDVLLHRVKRGWAFHLREDAGSDRRGPRTAYVDIVLPMGVERPDSYTLFELGRMSRAITMAWRVIDACGGTEPFKWRYGT